MRLHQNLLIWPSWPSSSSFWRSVYWVVSSVVDIMFWYVQAFWTHNRLWDSFQMFLHLWSSSLCGIFWSVCPLFFWLLLLFNNFFIFLVKSDISSSISDSSSSDSFDSCEYSSTFSALELASSALRAIDFPFLSRLSSFNSCPWIWKVARN